MDLHSQAEQLILSRYGGEMGMLPVIMKSLIHDEVLPALQQSGILKKFVFQGGTALQRFYNSKRFSEDLDFVCGQGKSLRFDPDDFEKMGSVFEQSVRTALARKYSLEVDSIVLRKPKDPYALRGQDVKVQVWQLKVPISDQGTKQMVKIEVANVPSYQSESRIWPVMMPDNVNLEPAPIVILDVESQAEIMADKVVALACRNHIKHRDIWDYHILESQGIVPQADIVQKKFKDYGIKPEVLLFNLKDKLASFSKKDQVTEEFWQEMERFVFPGVANQMKEMKMNSRMIESARAVLQKTKQMIERHLDQDLGL